MTDSQTLNPLTGYQRSTSSMQVELSLTMDNPIRGATPVDRVGSNYAILSASVKGRLTGNLRFRASIPA